MDLYAITEWGILFGLLFGWLPAVIDDIIVGLACPLVALALLYLFIQFL